jgi:hypothetical protein
MTINQYNSRAPSSEDSKPFGFGSKGTLSRSLLLLDECIASAKVSRLVVVVVPFVHRSKEFLEVDKVVLDNRAPDRAGNGISEWLYLHKIDKGVDGLVCPDCLP